MTAERTTGRRRSALSRRPGVPGVDPRPHGRAKAPGPELVAFDLLAFGQALEGRDVAYQVAQYAPDAEVRIIDPGSSPSAAQTVRGRADVEVWLQHTSTRTLELHVTHLLDGGDRVGFTERWHHPDGTTVVASSTAEIDGGLISMRHTILVRHRSRD